VYEVAMPGYEFIGVYSDSWINSDALHCRTHGVADTQMLYISHYPLYGDLAYQAHFEIDATISSYGGSSLSSGNPKLFYKQNSGAWETVTMNHTTGTTYTANIPTLSGSNTVSYYIYAENENDKTASLPRMGATDAFSFTYSGGTTAVNELKTTNFSITPNPTKGLFQLDTSLTSGKVTVYNLNGQQVYATSFFSF